MTWERRQTGGTDQTVRAAEAQDGQREIAPRRRSGQPDSPTRRHPGPGQARPVALPGRPSPAALFALTAGVAWRPWSRAFPAGCRRESCRAPGQPGDGPPGQARDAKAAKARQGRCRAGPPGRAGRGLGQLGLGPRPARWSSRQGGAGQAGGEGRRSGGKAGKGKGRAPPPVDRRPVAPAVAQEAEVPAAGHRTGAGRWPPPGPRPALNRAPATAPTTPAPSRIRCSVDPGGRTRRRGRARPGSSGAPANRRVVGRLSPETADAGTER